MNKCRNNELMRIANNVLLSEELLFNDINELSIDESYNGQIAAFGVSIAMSGLLPTLASYYKERSSTNVNRRDIIEVLAKMIAKDKASVYPTINNAETLFKFAIEHGNDRAFTKEVEECSIALKQIVRTFNLTKNDEH